jgi:hypothetical protein
MTTSRSPRTRHRSWLVVAVASATVLVPAVKAAATWQNSDVTLLEFRDVCRDGIRFGGAVLKDATVPAGDYEGMAIAVQPPPSTWAEWQNRAGQVMRTPVTIPEDDTTVELADGTPQPVSHKGDYTLSYQRGPLKMAPVALNLQDGKSGSDLNTANVTDCFLYAPIDVQPGASPNTVPIGHGEVSVAVLTTDIMRADRLKATTFRFGPNKAAARGSRLRDVNRDKRNDLVLRFGSVAAGLKCSTKTVHLTGKSPSDGTLEASDKVVPTGCTS